MTITQLRAGVGNLHQRLDVNPVEPLGVWVTCTDPRYDSANDQLVYMPALYLKYLVDEKNASDAKEFLAGAAQLATVFVGYGIVTSGASTIIKIAGAAQMATSATNLALNSDAVRRSLEQEDYGRKFLELWPTISTTVDVATITTFIYVARRSLIKLGRELSPIEQAKIETELTKAEVKFATFTDIEINQYVRAATRNPDANKVMLGKYDPVTLSSSYTTRAGSDYVYFELKDWNKILSMANESYDEMWKINRLFIERQFKNKKEFFLSHNPFEEKAGSFFFREIEYLKELGAQDFMKIDNNTWKAVW